MSPDLGYLYAFIAGGSVATLLVVTIEAIADRRRRRDVVVDTSADWLTEHLAELGEPRLTVEWVEDDEHNCRMTGRVEWVDDEKTLLSIENDYGYFTTVRRDQIVEMA